MISKPKSKKTQIAPASIGLRPIHKQFLEECIGARSISYFFRNLLDESAEFKEWKKGLKK